MNRRTQKINYEVLMRDEPKKIERKGIKRREKISYDGSFAFSERNPNRQMKS
jgi:hypothetical protein